MKSVRNGNANQNEALDNTFFKDLLLNHEKTKIVKCPETPKRKYWLTRKRVKKEEEEKQLKKKIRGRKT